MTNRENFLRALRRDNPQKVPFEFVLCPSQVEELKRRTGTKDFREHFGFPLRYIELNPTKMDVDYSVFYDDLPADAEPLHWNPEWGIMGVAGSTAHFQEMLHPMKNFTSVQQVLDYPWPDYLEDYRWQGVDAQIQNFVERDLIAIGNMQMTVFELAWYLRGMDKFMMDMVMDPDMANAIMDKLIELRVGMAKRFAGCGADILMLGDDVSTQEDMMMSPAMWRDTQKWRLAKVIDAARSVKPDILIFYHGDGNLQKIIPDLIEIGVDILNPVQPECMDPKEVKKLYGDNLSFWGCLGTQTTLPFGTADEVEAKCKELIETVGAGGGLLLAPTHMVEPDVPWENIEAFARAIDKYGRY
ncbi:methylcobalamin:coenzyme M methyltransferase [Anaerohalosphaera lusitana]|uniref:Methylcobalamin:coenzyme M methyltransferase n=1 Tax=Anaerohalosphaera lusitana TaxID=1936003 RepID=A0A1U9NL06_9BACT|nr:uroporphyrinogen decarboxylase family protein [Anaerohalosphaera lusitana]AQT68270.1 methylcobalamin:coenzyme M methyltransferase [Anaerohalosphaera lusitana]